MNRLIQILRAKPYYILIIGIIIFILGWLNLQYPVLRFSGSILNQSFLVLLFLIPAFLFVNLLWLSKQWQRVIGIILLFLPTLFFLLFAGFALFEMVFIISDGYDATFEKKIYTNLPQSSLCAYRISDSGPSSTTFRMVIRQERNILPGLLLVKNIFVQDQGDAVSFKLHDDTSVTLEYNNYDKNGINISNDQKVFKLKRYIYL